MCKWRGVLGVSLSVSLTLLPVTTDGAGKPLGVVTQATGAHLSASEAFAGLSVFEGEGMSTEEDGKITARVGASVLSLPEKSSVTVQKSGDGVHVELEAGGLFFSAKAENPVEVHAEEALLRPRAGMNAQADVTIFAPKVLQITAKQGDLDFSYGEEFRVLPAGQTYRIYLESAAGEPGQGPAGAGAGKDETRNAGWSTGTKVAFFIVAAAGAGLAAWGIHDWVDSHHGMESPAKP